MEGSKNLQKKSNNLNHNNFEESSAGPPYSYSVDFWSLGIVLFECLYGETPFYAESLIETYAKIINYSHSFEFPENDQISKDAKDLISNLICDKEIRFKTLDDFQNHSFFQNIDWNNLKDQTSPYQPQISGPDDTSNFDVEEIKQERNANNQNNNLANAFSSKQKDSLLNLHLPFIGYTCTFTLDQVRDNPSLDNLTLNNILNLGFETKLQSQSNSSNQQAQQLNLQFNNNSQSNQSAGHHNNQNKILNLEKELTTLRKERNELSSKMIEIRNEKSLIATKLRSKEEEIENQLEKTSEIRQQLNDAERLKRQHLETIISLETELDREKQLRKENQYEIKELEEKMIVVEEQLINYQSMKEDNRFEQENSYVEQITDLKYQLNERLHNLSERQDIIKELQTKLYETDQRLVEQEKLISSNQQKENRIKELEAELDELKLLQPKWEQQLSEIISWVGSEKEARSYLQEIAINMTKELENLKQQKQFSQYSNVRFNNSSNTSSNNNDKYSTLSNKGNQQQQESNYSTITWQERRSARVDKQDKLTLQLELKNEIEDKQRIQAELLRLQREMNSVMNELNESKNELARLKQQKQKQADSQRSLNQFQLGGGSGNSTLQSQIQLRNSNLIATGTNSNRQSLNLNNQTSILYQAQRDLQQKINAIQLSPLPTADFSDMDLLSPASSPNSDLYQTNQLNNNNKLTSFNQLNKNGNDNSHSFIIRTFVAPLKCFQCTSLMIGLVRQGLVCEVVSFLSFFFKF